MLLAGGLFAIAVAAPAQPLAMKDEAGMRWVCGGVGVEERKALAALEPQANLKLLFVTVRRGGYLADIALDLYDTPEAKKPRLSLAADGPICLVQAPAGRYRLEASFGDVRRTATALIGKEAGKPVRLVFSFPGEPWDGIWASEEEKGGARTP
jgi:hypothetical protein